MSFENPGAFSLLLILPAMGVFWGVAYMFQQRARQQLAERELYPALTRSMSAGRRIARNILFTFGVLFVIFAMTGPRFGTKTEILRRRGIDMVIALDTSYSMLAEDIKPNRIDQAKFEVRRLIDNLDGDRIGLVAFAGKSFVQCPLTTDYAAAKTLLETIEVGIIPEPGTDLGEALEGSLNLLERGSESSGESQMIILFTDGENLTSNPERTARHVASRGIRIFTVGIGTTAGEIIPIRNEQGQLEDYKKDSSGNVVKTALDEQTLTELARIGNGSYLRTENGEVDIQRIIDHLGSIHETDIHERKVSRLKERYQIPLGIGIVLLCLWLLIGERRRLKKDYRWSVTT